MALRSIVRVMLTLPCMLLLVTLSYANDSPKLQLITEEWPPYNYNHNGELQGFSVEVIQAVMRRLGEQHEILLLPGQKGEKRLDALPGIMNFSLFQTNERKNKFKWIGPISDEAIYLYKLRSNPRDYKTLDDAKNASVTSIYEGLVYNYMKNSGFDNLFAFSEPKEMIRLLLTGKVELLTGISQLGINYYLFQWGLPPSTLERTEIKLLDYPLYIACSPSLPDALIARWQKALDEVKQSGEYQAIYAKYLGNVRP